MVNKCLRVFACQLILIIQSISMTVQRHQKAIVLIDPLTEWKPVVKAAIDTDTKVIAVQLTNIPISDKMKPFIPCSSTLQKCGIHHVISLHDVFSCVRELQLLAEENNYLIDGVIPLSELAVDVCDMVAASLGVPHNTLKLVTSRRDKGLMKQAVAANGLRVAQFARVGSADELLSSMQKLCLTFPIVIKTPQGFSTTNVFICETSDEANSAVRSIVGKEGPNGRPVEAALLEEYIGGTEFAINLMAFQGNFIVTDVWKYEKNSQARYGSAEICHPHAHPELVKYAKAVAQAVGIEYGAAHVELKAKRKQSGEFVDPVLMEIGARLSGGKKATMMHAMGCNPYSALIEAHCGQSQKNQEDFIPTSFVRHLFLPIEKEGTIKELHYDFTSVTTFHSSFFPVKVGDMVSKTTDIISCAGFVWLIGDRLKVDKETENILSSFRIEME